MMFINLFQNFRKTKGSKTPSTDQILTSCTAGAIEIHKHNKTLQHLLLCLHYLKSKKQLILVQLQRSQTSLEQQHNSIKFSHGLRCQDNNTRKTIYVDQHHKKSSLFIALSNQFTKKQQKKTNKNKKYKTK